MKIVFIFGKEDNGNDGTANFRRHFIYKTKSKLGKAKMEELITPKISIWNSDLITLIFYPKGPGECREQKSTPANQGASNRES